MTASELREKIRILAREVYADRKRSDVAAVEYDELTKFPELKDVIVDLLGPQFDLFLASIDWVAPKPTTFRINLKNGESFYLIYNKRSWVAEVEGKKYYLLNLNEEENATNAIARVLRYGQFQAEGEQEASSYSSSGGGDFPGGEGGGDFGGGEEDVDIDVDVTDTEEA